MRAIGIAVLGWASIAIVFAQPACSPINFLTAPEVSVYAGAPAFSVSGLQRLPDGSYTSHTFHRFSPYAKLGAVPHFEQAFFACSGLGNRAVNPPPTPPRLGAGSLGTASRNPVVTDLIGDGSAAVVGIWDNLRHNQVLVGLSNPDISLKTWTGYAVGDSPGTVLVADFNGDGKRDVAVVNQGSSGFAAGSVSILLGNGDGTLRPAVNYNVGLQPFVAVAADFNGDGKLDLAVANTASNNVSILLGNGDGTFKTAVTYATGVSPYGIAAADFNGDGRMDLVVANQSRSGGLSLLLGNGDGSFKAATAIAVGSAQPFFVATGDFNKDQKVDLALVDAQTRTVYILLGNGNGTFQQPAAYSVGFFPLSLFVTDFDSDGNADVVIATGDPNGLAPNTGSGTITVLFGKGDGSFYAPPRYSVPGGQVLQIAAADFNGDGKPDLASANGGSGGVSIFLGNGNGSFQTPASLAISGPGAVALAPGDFNGDGKTDLAILDASGHVLFAPGNGAGAFQLAGSFPAGSSPAAIVAADLNGDGKLDLAVANNGGSGPAADAGNVTVLLGNGNGSFQAPATYPAGSRPVALAVADFNGDGKPDLAVAAGGTFGSDTDTGGVYLLLGKGDGAFQPAVKFAAGQNPVSITAADINGDRKADLLVSTYNAQLDNAVAVLLGSGNGGFQPAALLPTDFGATNIAVADFDGDGKPDLAIAHCCGNVDPTFMAGKGDGTFQPEVHVTAGSDPRMLLVLDLNGDGKPDLAVMNNTGGVTILLNISQPVSAAGKLGIASTVAPDSIASAYGARLATATATADSVPWPDSLAGTSITLTDAAGNQQPAPLYYASPGQVNFLIPAGTAIGAATLTLTAGDGSISTGTVQVASVAPVLFALSVLRVTADGTQTIESADAPIDLGPDTDQVYLILYGTGLRHRSDLSAVSVSIGAQDATVSYAGAGGDTPGLDQVNVLLPRALQGAGDVAIQLTVDGKTANPLHVTVQ